MRWGVTLLTKVPKLDIFTAEESVLDLIISINLSNISLLTEFFIEILEDMFLAMSLFFKDINVSAK